MHRSKGFYFAKWNSGIFSLVPPLFSGKCFRKFKKKKVSKKLFFDIIIGAEFGFEVASEQGDIFPGKLGKTGQ